MTTTAANQVHLAEEELRIAIEGLEAERAGWRTGAIGAMDALAAHERLLRLARKVTQARTVEAGQELSERYRLAVQGGDAHEIAMADAARHVRPLVQQPRQLLAERGITLRQLLDPFRQKLLELKPAIDAVT